jgi:GTP 3',8-cyclase
MPATCNGFWQKDKYVSSEEAKKRISVLGDLERLTFRGRGPSRNYRIKGATGGIGFISPLSDHFCGDCSRLRLTANGEIRPCLFSDIRIDIKTPMRNGASDEEIEYLFCRAVSVKPQGHVLNEDITSARHLRSMMKIGG